MLIEEYDARFAAANNRSVEAKEVADNPDVPVAIRAKAIGIMADCLADTLELLRAATNGEVRRK